VLTFGTFRELLDINAANRSNWLPLTPTFNCSYNELAGDTSFCLIGRDVSGVAVASHAGRLFDWRSGSFAEAAESLRLFYDRPESDALTGETCKVTSATARYLRGMVSYTGAVWYRPDYRGLGLAFYISRIARAYAYAQWSVDYAVGMVSNANVANGLTDKTGNSHIERGVHSRGSTHGDVDYHIVWSTPREIFEQLTVVLRTPEQESLSEAAGSVGCAGVKIRQLEALCRRRQRAWDEAGGALCEGSLRRSDCGVERAGCSAAVRD
jgi:hypothetical protein